MTKERDIAADLALCEAATPGPWRTHDAGLGKGHVYTSIEGVLNMVAEDARIEDAVFIAEAREGWPIAIRRAMVAEEKWAKLRSIVVTNATGGRGEDINDYDIIRNIMDDIDAEVDE